MDVTSFRVLPVGPTGGSNRGPFERPPEAPGNGVGALGIYHCHPLCNGLYSVYSLQHTLPKVIGQVDFSHYKDMTVKMAVDPVNTREAVAGTDELTTVKKLNDFLARSSYRNGAASTAVRSSSSTKEPGRSSLTVENKSSPGLSEPRRADGSSSTTLFCDGFRL